MADRTDQLLDAVRRAVEAKTPLELVGNGSKQFLGRRAAGDRLSTSAHSGVVDYIPSELVVTVRAGTSIAELADTLAGQGQWLGAEPPRFDGQATVAGTLSCNLSGPGRPWSGSLRDHVLGVRLINGRGEHLRFGGRVMKNVAGYDVSRLQAGAYGAFGLLTEITLRVQPRPESEHTRVLELDVREALARMLSLASACSPLSAACWVGGRLYLRLSGLAAAVDAAAAGLGGDALDDGEAFWTSIRDFRHPFFETDKAALWRLSLPAGTPVRSQDDDCMIDWGGAQRWHVTSADAAQVFARAAADDGQASRFRGGDRSGDVVQPASPVQRRILKQLKRAFDPHGIFNPGRLYPWL